MQQRSEAVPSRDDTGCIEIVNTNCIGQGLGASDTNCINMGTKPNTRLQTARLNAGFNNPAEFAKKYSDQIVESTYRSYENGTRNMSVPTAKLIGRLLGTDWAWLMADNDEKSASVHIQRKFTRSAPDLTKQQDSALSKDKLKVLGMAECGPDGLALWNGEVVDLVDRPAQLNGAPNSYAVFVVGTSMQPAHWSGRIAYIHPDKPVEIGCDVLIQMHPPEGESTPRAFLKHLVKRSGDRVIVEQYNPPKTFTLKRSEILSMHRVLGSLEP